MTWGKSLSLLGSPYCLHEKWAMVAASSQNHCEDRMEPPYEVPDTGLFTEGTQETQLTRVLLY